MTYQDLINEILENVRLKRISLDDDVLVNDQDGEKIEVVQFFSSNYSTSFIEVEVDKEN